MQSKPFCFNLSQVKAFVLGCDPTNFSDNGSTVVLDYVFGIGQDNRYFKDILNNLNQIGLHLEDIYIQNLIPHYLEEETSRNRHWQAKAKGFISERKKEFDRIDKKGKKPVFLTSELLYEVLLLHGETKVKAKELYNFTAPVPIPPEDNLMERPLIPLYRHKDYKLEKHQNYLQHIKAIMFTILKDYD